LRSAQQFGLHFTQLLGLAVEPIAQRQQSGFIPANRPVFKKPSLVVVGDDWEWRDQSTRHQGIADIGDLFYRNADPVERGLHCHGIAVEHHLAGAARGNILTYPAEPLGHSLTPDFAARRAGARAAQSWLRTCDLTLVRAISVNTGARPRCAKVGAAAS
jgi:hypothetical protein